MRTPTWAQIERYCRLEGWRETRRSGHVFYEKVLPDGTLLQTHRSHAKRKKMSPGRLKAIHRYQLKVTEEELWRVLAQRAAPGDGKGLITRRA